MTELRVSFNKKAVCAKVKVNPEKTKIKVFKKGIAKGSIIGYKTGGHTQPI